MEERFSPEQIRDLTKSREEALTDAEDIAKYRNERKIQSYAFGTPEDQTGAGVLQSEANIENKKRRIEQDTGIKNLAYGLDSTNKGIISGEYKGKRMQIVESLGKEKGYAGTVDDHVLDEKTAKKLFFKLKPTAESAIYNESAAQTIEYERRQVKEQRRIRESETTNKTATELLDEFLAGK